MVRTIFVVLLGMLLFTGCSPSKNSLHVSSERPAAIVYLDPPADFLPRAEVGGCFCESEGKLLFLLRSSHKPQGNTWCVPGGKLEQGETPQAAVLREVMEETGLLLAEEALRYCQKVYVRFPDRDIVLHLFRAPLAAIPSELSIAPDEHSTYRWVTFDEAVSLPLIPGGLECLRYAFHNQIVELFGAIPGIAPKNGAIRGIAPKSGAIYRIAP